MKSISLKHEMSQLNWSSVVNLAVADIIFAEYFLIFW